MDLPTHPESDDSDPDRAPSGATTSWATRVAIAVLIAAVAVIVLLHLTGVVGPASN
jgi:hypothetical protein